MFINYRYRLASTFFETEHYRNTLFAVAASFGGLMNFVLRLCNTVLAQFQGFALNNSMIKKLYSSRLSKEKKKEENKLKKQKTLVDFVDEDLSEDNL